MENSHILQLLLGSWSWNPVIILVTATVAGAYLYALRTPRPPSQQVLIKPSHPWFFGLGLLTFFIALQSSIDTLADQLFTMHMIQHLLLALVAAPLLLLGTPKPLISPLISWQPSIQRILQQLTKGTTAFLIFNITLICWHIPFFYQAALQNEAIHNLEHAMFFWAGLLSWWPILSPTQEVPRLSYPGQILYIFAIAIPGAILGAWLVFSERILYPWYAAIPTLWGMTTIEDQQMGGLIMMVPGKFVYFVALTIVFFLWFNQQDAPIQHHPSQKVAD